MHCWHVLITGNPGSYLTDSGSVYITRDGGLTWELVNTIHSIAQNADIVSQTLD